MSSEPDKPNHRREWLWVLIATPILCILGIALLGLPGAVSLEIAKALFNIDPKNCVGDGLWPAAIIVSLVSPLGLPIGYAVARLIKRNSRALRVLATLAVWSVFGLTAATLLYISAQNCAAKYGQPGCTPYRQSHVT